MKSDKNRKLILERESFTGKRVYSVDFTKNILLCLINGNVWLAQEQFFEDSIEDFRFY